LYFMIFQYTTAAIAVVQECTTTLSLPGRCADPTTSATEGCGAPGATVKPLEHTWSTTPSITASRSCSRSSKQQSELSASVQVQGVRVAVDCVECTIPSITASRSCSSSNSSSVFAYASCSVQ
jgi:hypothetical protein